MMKLFSAFTSILAALPLAVHAFSNPVLYQDLSDIDLRRVNNTYYMSTSTFHFSPGAPILRSYNLVNWEYIGHSVPHVSDFGSQYTLSGGRNYVGGIWASWLIYVPGNSKWYWGGCIGFANTHIYASSSSDPASSWSRIATISGCQYDSGALLDSDGRVYVAYKADNKFYIAKYSTSMTSVESRTLIYTPSDTGMEGLRPYKINGNYYIFSAAPGSGTQYLLRASSINGPYTLRSWMTAGAPSPLSGNAFQGALVDTPSGQWYWMSASALGWPAGRVPLLMPVSIGSDGWPAPTLSGGRIGSSYSDIGSAGNVKSVTGLDTFSSGSLDAKYEWNHEPDTSKVSFNGGLKLSTVTVTSDLFAARNTITQRSLGPTSTTTIQLSIGSMASGDRAGLVYLRESSAYIGVWKSGSTYTINMVNNLKLQSGNGWTTVASGSTAASASVPSGVSTVFFRIIADVTVGGNNAKFYYSTNGGSSFTQLGGTFVGTTDWPFFPGYRYGVFNFATSATGGSVTVNNWDLRSGAYTGAASGSTTGTSSSTSTTTTTTTTTTTSNPGTNCAAMWGQCGGQGWTGPTCCSQGTCTYSNDFYSQCI